MPTTLTDEMSEFLSAANPAVITAVRPDGQPVSVATWYLLEDDGRILVNMDAGRKRLDYLRADPRVSLTVLGVDGWYQYFSLQGRVTDWRDDEDLADVDRLSRHYGNDAYPNRVKPRVSARIEIDRVHAWGAQFK